MRLNDEQWTRLASELGRTAARAAPSWTGANAHDPGITIATFFAFLAEQLGHRFGTLSPPAQAHVREILRHAAASIDAAGGGRDDAGPGLRRPRYWTGKLLEAGDLQAEQDYVIGRLNRRNRLVHGAGIASGLAVAVQPGDDGRPAVLIAPGLAFDPLGREIHLDAPCCLPLPESGAALWVLLRFRERPDRFVPVAAQPLDDATGEPALAQPTRIVESFEATLGTDADADAVTVARVQRSRGRWRIDAGFEAPRVRC